MLESELHLCWLSRMQHEASKCPVFGERRCEEEKVRNKRAFPSAGLSSFNEGSHAPVLRHPLAPWFQHGSHCFVLLPAEENTFGRGLRGSGPSFQIQ